MARATKVVLVAVAAACFAPMAVAGFWSTWFYFVFDPARFVEQSLVYAEAENKNAAAQAEADSAKERQEEMKKIEEQFGPKVRGDLKNALSADDARAAEDLKMLRARRDLIHDKEKQDSYDLYIKRVELWRAQMAAYRAKITALQSEANGKEHTYLEWKQLQSQFMVTLAEVQIAAVNNDNDLQGAKTEQWNERARLLSVQAERRAMRDTANKHSR